LRATIGHDSTGYPPSEADLSTTFYAKLLKSAVTLWQRYRQLHVVFTSSQRTHAPRIFLVASHPAIRAAGSPAACFSLRSQHAREEFFVTTQLALYAQPAYSRGELVEVIIGNVWTTARIDSGSQDLEAGGWSYSLRIKTAYNEFDASCGGTELGYISLGGRWNPSADQVMRKRIAVPTFEADHL